MDFCRKQMLGRDPRQVKLTVPQQTKALPNARTTFCAARNVSWHYGLVSLLWSQVPVGGWVARNLVQSLGPATAGGGSRALLLRSRNSAMSAGVVLPAAALSVIGHRTRLT